MYMFNLTVQPNIRKFESRALRDLLKRYI